jgi:uncharacterized SAM-binding protein YcdF (DUF218 family)
MFFLKKIITSCLLPPGFFILVVLTGALFARRRLRLLLVCLSAIIYVLSIEPTKDLLLRPLERSFSPPTKEEIMEADAYVYLCGGQNETAPTVDGLGELAGDSLVRLFGTYRLYQIKRKPVILSGGVILNRGPEAEIAKKTLVLLGVKPGDLAVETKSKDTNENARYVAAMCAEKGLKRIVLVTNAYHMRRSLLLFNRYFEKVTPYPCGYYSQNLPYNYLSYIPAMENIEAITRAAREYMGILFYTISGMGRG